MDQTCCAISSILRGRCFRAVDCMSDEEPQCIAMDEQTDHKIVHAFRLCTAHGTMYETLDAGAESDGLAFNLLRMLFPDDMLLRAHMPFVGTQPSVSNHVIPQGVSTSWSASKTVSVRRPKTEAHTMSLWGSIACHSHRGSACFPTSLHIAWHANVHPRRWASASVRQSAPQHGRGGGAATRPDALGLTQGPFSNSFRTVVGLTGNTRTVSRISLTFMVLSTTGCLMAGDGPA